jgi:hypothetical protein
MLRPRFGNLPYEALKTRPCVWVKFNLLAGSDLAMPQPIPPGKEISFDFRPSSVLERPKLAPYIAAILMSWNEIESHVGVFLAALLGDESQTVIKVFLALQTDGGRRSTIDTVTKLKLSPTDLERFQEVQHDIGRRYAERNKAVHGAWGTSYQYPDDLLWYDPRESVAALPDLMKAEDGNALKTTLAEVNKSIRIYNETDFKDIITRFEQTETALKAFTATYVGPLFQKMNRQRFGR